MASRRSRPDDQDDPDLCSVPIRPPFSRENYRVLGVSPPKWSPPEVAGRRLLGVRGPPKLVRHSLTPLLAFVADDRLPEATRWRKALALMEHAPAKPVHQRRIPAFRDQCISDDEIRQAAAEALIAAPWENELLEADNDAGGVWIRLDRLRAYLNRETTERLLGPGASARREQAAQERFDSELEIAARRRQAAAETEALADIRHRAVEARADDLTEAQASVYLLVERDGLSPSEAAEELDISAAAARNRLRRARESLTT